MPRARERKERKASEAPSKAWLESYADAITLLLAFFVLLYSFAMIDKEKFMEFKLGVQSAFGKPNPTVDGGLGLLERGTGIATLVQAPPVVTDQGDGAEGPVPSELDQIQEITRDNVEQVAEELRRRIDAVGASELVEVADDPRGLVIRFDSAVLFRSGEALILPDGVLVLGTVSDILAAIDNLLVVEGHTDDVPTGGTTWPTNWELSTARATTVLRYLVELEGLPAVRVSAAGYADTRPRDTNSTDAGRQANRRVEVVVVIETPHERTATTGRPTDTGLDPGVLGQDRAAPDPMDIRNQVLDLEPVPPFDQ